MRGEDAREREKVICEVGTATWESVRVRERRERKGGRRERREREDEEERTGDKQSISFLPSYSPRQLLQLRVLARNILLILLSISCISQLSIPTPSASGSHVHT